MIKGIAPRLIWGERDEEARTLLRQDLESRRIGANTWDLDMMVFRYREGRFWPPVPSGNYEEALDEALRVMAVNGVIAKTNGFAVHVALGFLPERPFSTTEDLVRALDRWGQVVERVAEVAERYRFEYLAPCSELDHVIRWGSGLQLDEEEVRRLYNKYSVLFREAARSRFSGKIEAKLGDVYPEIRNSIFAYNLSGADLIGFGTGSPTNRDAESFRRDLSSQIAIVRELADMYGVDWYVSEVWIFCEGRPTAEKLARQAELYWVFCDTIRSAGCRGASARFWNYQEEGLFSNVMDTPAEETLSKLYDEWS